MTLSIQEISDRLEIEQLLIRYCHAIDERDWDTYRSVYTEDAIINDIGAGPGNTVDQMVEFLPRGTREGGVDTACDLDQPGGDRR
jgi:hypothetical protein